MGDSTTTVLAPLPAASNEMVGKLSKVLSKRFTEICKKVGVKCDSVPEVATEESSGDCLHFGFIKHKYDFECENVCAQIPRLKLDKRNSIFLTTLKKVREFDPQNPPDVEAELQELAQIRPRLRPELFNIADKSTYWDWFLNSGDEMFCLRHGDMTEIYQFDGATYEPKLVNSGEVARAEYKKKARAAALIGQAEGDRLPGNEQLYLPWTHDKAFWTPQGSMLATTHAQGIRLWGGADFGPINRLKHTNVQYASFSKNEEYVATCDNIEKDGLICIHSVLTGECLARLPIPKVGPHGRRTWPLVCWSHNSEFVACHHPEGISVYQLPDMVEVSYNVNATTKLDYLPFKNSLFSWQPNSDTKAPAVLAIWTAFKNESAPSRLTILQIPSMQIAATRNIFSVDGLARTFWQKNGTHCALVTQVQKKLSGKKRVNQTQLDIFTMKTDHHGTLDAHWVNIEHDVISVVWSDCKSRLAVLLGNCQILFYSLSSKGLQQCGPPLDIQRDINSVFWSPLGTHFVLASCDAEDPTGTIWFGVCAEEVVPSATTSGNADTTSKSGTQKKAAAKGVIGSGLSSGAYTPKIIHKDEKSKLRHVDWDPSGRYVATSVTSPIGNQHAFKTEGARGYTIWSSQGKPIYTLAVDQLHRFQWRPHPLVHLTDADRDAVMQNMTKYSKVFDSEDTIRKNIRRQEVLERRTEQQAEFKIAVQEAESELMALPEAAAWIEAEKIRSH